MLRMHALAARKLNFRMGAAALAGGTMWGSARVLCDADEADPPPAAAAAEEVKEASAPAAGASEEVNPLTDSEARYLGYAGRSARLMAFKANMASNVRYLGYSSDIGESMRPVLDPKHVRLFYGITWAYVFADVLFQGHKEHSKGRETAVVQRKMVETLTFQSLASVALPTLIIHQVVHGAQKLLATSANLRLIKYGPMAAGFACLPLLPYLDEPAEHLIEQAFEQMWPLEGDHQAASE